MLLLLSSDNIKYLTVQLLRAGSREVRTEKIVIRRTKRVPECTSKARSYIYIILVVVDL